MKTTNILLASSEPPYVAKLGDGGLGRLLVRNEGKPVIPQSAVDHSRGYVDPAYAKKGNVVAASDVYACGVVLLELLSGQLPFTPGREPPALSQFAFDADYDEKTLLDPTLSDCPPRVASGLSGSGGQVPLGKTKAALQDPRGERVVARSAGCDAQLPDGDLIEDGPDSCSWARRRYKLLRAVSGLRRPRQRAATLRPAPVLQQSPGTQD